MLLITIFPEQDVVWTDNAKESANLLQVPKRKEMVGLFTVTADNVVVSAQVGDRDSGPPSSPELGDIYDDCAVTSCSQEECSFSGCGTPKCLDLPISSICICPPGYTVNMLADPNLCVDINECASPTTNLYIFLILKLTFVSDAISVLA